MNAQDSNSIGNKKLEECDMKAIGDLGNSLGAMMVISGDRLGLYRAVSKFGTDFTRASLKGQYFRKIFQND